MTLTSGHTYTFRPYLRNSDESVIIYGTPITFFVVTNDWQSYTPATESEYEALASSTEQIGQTSTMANLLMERPPFLWFKQINEAYASSTQSTTTEMPSLTLNFASSSIPFTVTMFSSTTLSTLIPADTHELLYGIMQASIYAFGIYALYRRVQGAFTKDENSI